jgi:hypothetical protein
MAPALANKSEANGNTKEPGNRRAFFVCSFYKGESRLTVIPADGNDG